MLNPHNGGNLRQSDFFYLTFETCFIQSSSQRAIIIAEQLVMFVVSLFNFFLPARNSGCIVRYILRAGLTSEKL